MKISIVIHSNTAATVTRIPSWLGRLLLGRRETTRAVYRPAFGCHWFYSDTHRDAGRSISDAIEYALTLHAVRARHESLVCR